MVFDTKRIWGYFFVSQSAACSDTVGLELHVERGVVELVLRDLQIHVPFMEYAGYLGERRASVEFDLASGLHYGARRVWGRLSGQRKYSQSEKNARAAH
jgi:hypothetical protein